MAPQPKSPPGRPAEVPTRTIVAGMCVAVASISSAALFVRLAAPLDSSVIAALRVTVTGLGLCLIAPGSAREALIRCLRDPRLAGRTGLAGALLALHFASWIASLELTSVARSVVLVSTQPLFAGAMGRLLGDRAHPGLYIGAGVAIVGSAVMVTDGSADLVGSIRLGDGLALLGGAAAAAYLVVGRAVRDALPLKGYFAVVNLVAMALLFMWVAVRGTTWAAIDEVPWSYACVLYLGLVPGLFGHGLLNWAVRRLPAHTVSLAVLLEPVGAAALAWVVLGESIGPAEGAGAMLLLAGVAVGLLWARRAASPGARSKDEPSLSDGP